MIPGDALLDAFIDANILVCVAYALWLVTRILLGRLGLKHAYGTQLRLLNSVFLTVAFAPFVVLLYTTLQRSGIAGGVQLNLSDMIVSHYLNGGIGMKATEFENLILMRDTFTLNVLSGAGWVAWAAIAAFLAGTVIGGLRLVCSMFCLHRIVADSYAWRSFGRVRIRLSDRTLVPFSTRGLRTYYVVLPSHMLGRSDEMRVSLAHEFQHLRQGDLEWEILLEALKPLFFLNPAYHAWKRQVENLRELNCDSEVLTRGRIGIRTYCETLLSVCQKTLRRDRAFVIAVPKVTLVTADRSVIGLGKQSFLERRINSLLDRQRLAQPRLVFAAAVLPLIAAILLTAVAIQRPGDWSQDRLMLSTVVNLERLDEINRLSTFGRVRD
ncbi:beta-lactamase regulating signal transducer with metallopeptidase domain [Rhodovulum iodosum]|uniref:Beta-lactamase regulating signal transducer with metallopeptidase domain n=1 Tax=Rhodovulum iodosum TaxID=68291 RepID=A0ABV3XNX1_9RHOB|nr:M56 family metallopeptidase [Rhodovulum robiginosum]RSK34808.1 M56 family metallopeptidase [Rhodovulum robiginosum]